MGSSEASLWRFDSPLIYLFGGISLILALITVALVILACSQRKRRLAGGDIESSDDAQKPATAAYNGCDGADYGPKIVVIMAGDDVPTYLATPSDVVTCDTHVSKYVMIVDNRPELAQTWSRANTEVVCVKTQTDWEGGYYPLTLKFSEDYPSKPPVCKFPQGFFHPNVYSSGMVCLSILSESSGWRPAITVKQILVGIQDLLDTPNPATPAQNEAYGSFVKDLAEYKRRVRQQGKRYPPSD